jgi:hypothetical protein
VPQQRLRRPALSAGGRNNLGPNPRQDRCHQVRSPRGARGGAKEVVNNNCVVSKKQYLKQGETDAANIMRPITAIKTAMLDAQCAAIVQQQRTVNCCAVMG